MISMNGSYWEKQIINLEQGRFTLISKVWFRTRPGPNRFGSRIKSRVTPSTLGLCCRIVAQLETGWLSGAFELICYVSYVTSTVNLENIYISTAASVLIFGLWSHNVAEYSRSDHGIKQLLRWNHSLAIEPLQSSLFSPSKRRFTGYGTRETAACMQKSLDHLISSSLSLIIKFATKYRVLEKPAQSCPPKCSRDG